MEIKKRPGVYERTPEIREKMREASLNFYQNNPARRIGMKHSLQTRKKISESHLKLNDRLRQAGLPHPLAGRKISDEHKQSQSKAMKGRFAGSKNYFWKGGRTKSIGYILISVPGHPEANARGYVQEHRLVMERILGRLLRPEETVHHINHNRRDNRVENLLLLPNCSAHSKLHGFLRSPLDGLR